MQCHFRNKKSCKKSHLGDLLPVPVEAPAADLGRSDHVLDEQHLETETTFDSPRNIKPSKNILAHPVAEPEAELVEELDVLQYVVVGGARVGVLVVVAVDEELHDRLLRVGGDQGLVAEVRVFLNSFCVKTEHVHANAARNKFGRKGDLVNRRAC